MTIFVEISPAGATALKYGLKYNKLQCYAPGVQPPHDRNAQNALPADYDFLTADSWLIQALAQSDDKAAVLGFVTGNETDFNNWQNGDSTKAKIIDEANLSNYVDWQSLSDPVGAANRTKGTDDPWVRRNNSALVVFKAELQKNIDDKTRMLLSAGFEYPYPISVTDGGSGHNIGDLLTVTGGTSTAAVTCEVTKVSSGAVTEVRIVNRGAYSVWPANPVSTSSDDSGAGCTLTLIRQGTAAGSTAFSLSSNAQHTWTNMYAGKALIDLPQVVTTADETTDISLLSTSDVDAFYAEFFRRGRYVLDQGRQLKNAVRDATDETTAVAASVDTRS